MINQYLILNKNPNILMKIFIYNIIFITGLIIWGINTISYQKYYLIHSQVLNLNSYYCIEVLIPVKEVKKVTSNNNLWINKKKYHYIVKSTDNHITYKNKINYIKLYLKVLNLEKEYQIDGYRLDVKKKKE